MFIGTTKAIRDCFGIGENIDDGSLLYDVGSYTSEIIDLINPTSTIKK